MRKRNIKKAISETLELPRELVEDIPKISIIDNEELTIENYKGIVEYTAGIIRVNTKNYMLKIAGTELYIKNISDEEIMINGKIETISYE